MAEQNGQPKQAPQGKNNKAPEHSGGKSNVVALPTGCLVGGCKTKVVKAGFCTEHFDWYKEGIVTKEGRKPVDFDKKLYNFQKRTGKAA
jgi:hypothetical protein